MSSNSQLAVDCNSGLPQYALAEDVYGINRSAAEEDEKKGKIPGRALMITNRRDEKGSASK